MNLLLSLALAALLIIVGRDFLKKHAAVCYVLAAAVALIVVFATTTGANAALPEWVRTWVWPIFSRSAFSTALFVAVMYAGAVPNGSRFMKAVMPIRGELSILACILTLGHNISYGLTYFRLLFTQPAKLPANQLAAAICSLVMLCIMLPLFVTSFPTVRRKMSARKWKRLQRLAYGFYGLIYVHVLLLALPIARKGNRAYMLSVALYSVIFLTYAAMRTTKALKHQQPIVQRIPMVLAACSLVLICGSMVVAPTLSDSAAQMAPQSSENSVEVLPDKSTAELAEPEENGQTSADDAELPQQESESTETVAASAAETAEDIVSDTEPQTYTVPEPSHQSKPPQAQSAESQNAETKPTETAPVETAPEETAPVETVPAVTYTYRDGTFTGSGEGFEGTITVSVTIQSDKITAINVTEFSDDEPYWSDGKSVISRILAANSVNVDTVSGATYSSGGIISAVKNALNSAKN